MFSNYLLDPKIVLRSFSRWYHFTKSTSALQRFVFVYTKSSKEKWKRKRNEFCKLKQYDCKGSFYLPHSLRLYSHYTFRAGSFSCPRETLSGTVWSTPIRHVTLHFWGQRGTASHRYRYRTGIMHRSYVWTKALSVLGTAQTYPV